MDCHIFQQFLSGFFFFFRQVHSVFSVYNSDIYGYNVL